MFELIILIVIAAVVLFYLRSIIGTRTGHEGPPSRLSRGGPSPADDGTVTPIKPQPLEMEETASLKALDAPSREALEGMRDAEPEFNLDEFMGGAKAAYEMILMAYEEGDRKTLQDLLTPDVFQAFDQGISARDERGLRVEARFIGVRDVRPERLEFEPEMKEADVTLRFVGEMITAVRDPENRVVEGDPNEIRRQTDTWTFSRVMGSRNPNWLLSGTGE
ncbi:MAG: Tim44/TimA family putative adaptor protein [Pseudomonadota bacterium]